MDPGPVRQRLAWLPLPLAMALAWWGYRPLQARPFDVLDFSEFLPLLTKSGSAPARFGALVDYYAGTHGRLNLLSYAALVLKWSWLGPDPRLWQVGRATLLCAIAGLMFLLLRRLAVGRFSAAVSASLLLFSYSAALPWVRLTMGEPLGLLFALLAGLAATHMPPGSSWQRIVSPGLLLGAAILAKEMLVIWVPVVMVIAITREADGRLATWRRDLTIRRFLLSTTLCIGLILMPVWFVARKPNVAGYSASYGAASLNADRLVEIFQRQFLPWPVTGRGDAVAMLLVAVGLLAILTEGMRLGLRSPDWRRHCLRVLAIGIGLPLVGALVYVPWPLYSSFYGYPFLFGVVLLWSTALTVIGSLHARAKSWASAVTILAIVVVVPESLRLAAANAAQQEIRTGLAKALTKARDAEHVVVAVSIPPMQAWQGMGPSLSRYAMATTPGLSLPPARDISCVEASELLAQPRHIAVISLDTGCGDVPNADTVVSATYRYWRWEPPGLATDTIHGTMRVFP